MINQEFFKVARINERHGGARPNAGRKPKAQEQDALKLMTSAWPMARRRKAIKALADAAEKGNVKAVGLLMAYAYGKPKETHQHTGEDGGPLKVIVEYGSGSEHSDDSSA